MDVCNKRVDVTSDAAVNNAVPRCCTRCKGRGRTKGKIHSPLASNSYNFFFPLLLLHSLVKNDISISICGSNMGVD